ncbi:MAG: hypothetical protein ACT4P9_10555 [Betaproteobacteria bacterium]
MGAALLVMLAIVGLAGSWLLLSQLNAESGGIEAVRKKRNAEILNRAKQALIGYVAAQAAKSFEDRPGALPCPEAPGSYGDSANEGTVSYPCTLPITGRLPWKTLGLDKLVDASGEPLWYAVASGWAGSGTVINSNCTSYDASSTQACRAGRLSVDGTTSDVIALIIAPGPAINVVAASGCTAHSQSRPTSGTPNILNYLECENATSPGNTFVTVSQSASFNDQVIAITAADLLPGVEAAIADRIAREIVPLMKSAYTSSTWHSALSATRPLLPYPAPFGNPSTSDYGGIKGTAAPFYGGLLPVNLTQSCSPATEPRCVTPTTGSSTLLTFSKSGADTYVSSILPPIGSIRTQSTCNWQTDNYVCTGEYLLAGIMVTVRLRVANVAGGFRTYDLAGITCTAVDDAGGGLPQQNIGCVSSSLELQPDGSALITVTTNWTPLITLMGWGTYANYVVTFPRSIFGDHSFVANTSDPVTRWFWTNEWYRLLYYVVASGNSADALPAAPSCVTAGLCLTVANASTSQNGALLILAGRSINGSARPSTTLADYLEFGNAMGTFEKQPISKAINTLLRSPFNDRLIAVDSN